MRWMGALLLLWCPSVWAGPVILDGMDQNDHGCTCDVDEDGTGADECPGGAPPDCTPGAFNHNGWKYMEDVLENLAAQVNSSVAKVVVSLGTTAISSSEASQAIRSAFDLSTLPSDGWTLTHVDGVTAIDSWLDALSTSNTGILVITTSGHTVGDLSPLEAQEVNVSHTAQLSAFLVDITDPSVGGAIFSMSQGFSTNPYGWLESLVTGLSFEDLADQTTAIQLTSAGAADFPHISSTDISPSPGTPNHWHGIFLAPLGALTVLVETEAAHSLCTPCAPSCANIKCNVAVGRGSGVAPGGSTEDSWIWISKKEEACPDEAC